MKNYAVSFPRRRESIAIKRKIDSRFHGNDIFKRFFTLFIIFFLLHGGCPCFSQVLESVHLADGVDYSYIVKWDGSQYVTAHVLDCDLETVDIFPALGKPSESFFESVVGFFTPWAKKKKPGFYKAKVSQIVKENGALAGINGTYFDKTGQPLGVLMINGRLLSYPISDRTSFILTKDGKAYIDNIIMDAYFEVGDVKYTITGINEPRSSKEDIILYTPDYGELTKTNQTGFDMTVENGVVSQTRYGNSWIPENGFVISAGALYAEYLLQTINIGDKISVVINVIPYSTKVDGEPMHLIGGGPRIVKSGRIYISKYEENFRRDIARGRAARSAVGITKDNHILFVAVDGKPRRRNRNGSRSRGMSLTELAYFLREIGAHDALNLDGGGSTTLVVGDVVANFPSDISQRKVSNAILIKPKE